MKGITVRQPWAQCIASGAPGAKRVENRGRPTSYRGTLAIHAGKTADVAADTDPRVVRLWGTDPRHGAPVGAVIAVLTGPPIWIVHPASAVPGFRAYAPGRVLLARAPATAALRTSGRALLADQGATA